MKKMSKRRITAVLAIITLLAVLMTGCGDKSEIKGVISDFEKACNKLDLNDMLECIDPAISGPIKMATGIVGLFSNTNSDEMLERLSDILTSGTAGGGKDFFSSIEITVDDIDISGDKAEVGATLKYTVAGEDHETETVFKCVKSEDEWYISSLGLK